MTYLEWLEQNPTVMPGTGLDDATIGAIKDWFAYRYVCDNNKFTRFFTREIALHKWQYEQMVRLESVDFDPMVSNYVERWVNRTGSDTHTGDSTDTVDGTTRTKNNSTTDGTSTPGVTETRNSEQRLGTSQQTVDSSTETPNLTTTAIGSADGTGSDTNGSTTDVTGSTSNSGTNTHSGSNTSGDKQLTGILPDSTTYGSTMPTALNWQYADNQNEASHTGSDNSTDTNSSEGSSTGKTTVSGSGSSTTHSESESTTKQTGTNSREGTSTVTNSGTNTNNETITRTGSDKTNQTVTGSGEVTISNLNTRADKAENTFEHTDKEIATGRSQAPQEMLDRARSYFLHMNAFDWFRKRLDICFLNVYNDVEGGECYYG